MLNPDYMALKVSAPIIPDGGGYRINTGEMNPAIFERFVGLLKKASPCPAVWEPFAGTSCNGSSPRSVTQDIAEKEGIRLISYGLAPRDGRIVRADSTKMGPNMILDGALFHPPYYGSAPMSDDPFDLSRTRNFTAYRAAVDMVAWRVAEAMSTGGSVCAVGRDYRYEGERVQLDYVYLDIFGRAGFQLSEVWLSPPDIVLLFGRKI